MALEGKLKCPIIHFTLLHVFIYFIPNFNVRLLIKTNPISDIYIYWFFLLILILASV